MRRAPDPVPPRATDAASDPVPGLERVAFGPLDIGFDHRVLRPRQWTLAQSRWAAELSPTLPGGPLLELCTGAGQIGLVAVALTGRPAVLVDAAPAACALARANAALQADRDGDAAAVVEVREGEMDHVLGPAERFPLVLADPPYLPTTDVSGYPEDPVLAVDGGDDGLDLARSCLRVVATHMSDSGACLLQLLDAAQAERLEPQLRASGLRAEELRVVGEAGVLLRLGRAE